ncbi:MAG: transcription antitermination factor NusB [Phototrophicales bacterium]|nr:MAG: transcription antitermination factor NusB [Phototrophicales bacterium]
MKKEFRRHLARTATVLALYELDATNNDPETVLIAYTQMNVAELDARVEAYRELSALESFSHKKKKKKNGEKATIKAFNEAEVQMFQRLMKGAMHHREQADSLIATYAPEWPTDQIASVDRAILRVAIYEMLYEDVPIKVVINEAVEIAKLLGGDSSPRFINGVLGSIVDNLDTISEKRDPNTGSASE